MYSVARLSTNCRNTDNSQCYDSYQEFATWRELVSHLAYCEKYANAVFCGRGANILQGETVIGHTRNFELIDKPTTRITRREFLAEVAEE